MDDCAQGLASIHAFVLEENAFSLVIVIKLFNKVCEERAESLEAAIANGVHHAKSVDNCCNDLCLFVLIFWRKQYPVVWALVLSMKLPACFGDRL